MGGNDAWAGLEAVRWRRGQMGIDSPFDLALLVTWTIGVAGASAFLHECGHAWTARAVGWDLVTLRWRWYGVALVADQKGRSDQLWKVALGGLLATALLATGFLAGSALPQPATSFFRIGFAFNAMLLLTNLVPVSRVDGGHVLAGLRQVHNDSVQVPSSLPLVPAPAPRPSGSLRAQARALELPR